MLKYEDAAAKLAERIPKEEDFPRVVLIDTISYCNLKCSMCSHRDMKRKPGIMSWDLYKKIIDEIARERPEATIWITFFGEGGILKDLPEKIQYAKEQGLTDIRLNSNGCLINKEYGRRLIEAGLDKLLVGIDAFLPETYTQIRVGGRLEEVVENVLSYKHMLSELGRDKEQEVITQFVEMDTNKAEEQDFIQFWNGYGVRCKIRPMISWAGSVKASNLRDDMERLPCYWAMNTINITDQGTVALCSVDLNCQVPMGDINQRSIKEIWNHELYEFRTKHREARWNMLPELCRECNDWQSGYADYL